jgi:glycosyltransferase involved in cell wall biosynthesis
MTMRPHLSVVLPCRNQGDHIGAVLPRYLAPLEALGLPFELVVVPNASTDNTQEVVANLARRDPRIRVVPNPLGGWGRAVLTGLDAAAGRILLYTNTARTDPAALPRFVRCYLDHAPCLVKARREQRKAPLRELGSRLYNLEGRLLFGIPVKDVNGTPKVFAREFYEELRLAETGDLLDLELMAQAAQRGTPVLEIPVQGFQRHGGRSSTTWRSAWRMYAGAFRLWWSLKRRAA